MKILLVNSFHYYRGGDCTYTFALANLLESQGHRVAHFAMDHPANIASEFSRYFVSRIDYDAIFNNGGLFEKLKTAPKLIYSTEAKKRFEQLVHDFRPDIVHLQNVHHLVTLSILSPIKKLGLPSVWTLHDYNLLCPNIHFLRANGSICEACQGGRFYRALLYRCKRGSTAASLVVGLSSYLNQRLQKQVNLFISPSLFLKDKFVAGGYDPKRIAHLPHFITRAADFRKSAAKRYFLYSGRLAREKGLETLLKAMKGVDSIELIIAGDGPLRTELQRQAGEINNRFIKFVGHLSQNDLLQTLGNAEFAVLPSECYENFAFAILEAFSLAKPVVASRIGGLPELVKDNRTGLLFEPGDAVDLRSKILHLADHPDLARTMGLRAREQVETELAPDQHYEQLISIYRRLVG